MNLPPVMVPFVADLQRLTQGFRQAQQLARQGMPNVSVNVALNMGNAQQQVAALSAQMTALKQAIADSSTASGQYRTNIAALTAQTVQLRADIASTVQQLRAKGASMKDTALFTQQLRTQLQAVNQALSQERVALANSTEATRQQRAALADVRTQLGQAQKAYDDLAKSAQQAAKQQTDAAKAGKDAQSGGFGSGFASRAVGSSLNYGVAFGVGAAVGGEVFNVVTKSVKAASDAVIGFNGDLEQSRVAFTTFLGGAQQASDFLKQLQQFAIATPFEFPDLVDASKRMLAFGFSAQQVLPLLTAVGNQASAVGLGAEGVNRLTLALGQMQAKGHVSGEELRQLSEAGVQLDPIFQEVAKQLGITTAQARDLADKGNLSAGIFIDAFQKVSQQKFGDLMQRQSQTFQGAMSNIHDALRIFVAQMGAPLFTAISNAAQRLATFLQTPQFQQWANQAVTAIQQVIAFLGALGGAVGKALGGLAGIHAPTVGTPDMGDRLLATGAATAANALTYQLSDQGSKEREITQEIIKQGGVIAANDKLILANNEKIAANRDAQQQWTDKIQDTGKAYDDTINKLERQVADIERLTPQDIANKQTSALLQQQIIDVKIKQPDTTGLEHKLRDLQRQKEDLGSFDATPYEAPIKELQEKIRQISQRDTKDLDAAIKRVQDNIKAIGRRNNDDLDGQIKTLQRNIDGLSEAGIKAADKQIAALRDQISNLNTDELDRKIEDVQAKLNAPPPDFTGLNSQLAAQAALIQAGAGDSANAAFAGLSLQKQQLVDATRNQQTGLKAQLAALTVERDAQRRYNDDTKKALEGQIKTFEAQKTAIQESNAAQKAGWEAQIKALQEIKERRDRQNRDDRDAAEQELENLQEQKQDREDANKAERDAAQNRIDELNKEKDAAQEAFNAYRDSIDKQIQATQRLIQDTKQPYEDEIESLTRRKEMVDLDIQRNDLAKEMKTIPLKQQIDDEKRAKQDTLAPYQAALELAQRQGQELDSNNRKLELEKQNAQALIDTLKQDQANAPPKPPGPPPGGVPLPEQPAFIGPIEQTGVLAFLGRLTTKLHEVTDSDDFQVIFYGHHKDGTPVTAEDRWKTLGDDLIKGLNGVDKRLHDWIKSNDPSGNWMRLIYGENPDGTRASIMDQLNILLGGLGGRIKKWFVDDSKEWGDTSPVGKAFVKAFDSFRWDNIKDNFNNVADGVFGWIHDNTPGWVTDWSGAGDLLSKAWHKTGSFNRASVDGVLTDISGGFAGWFQEHTPGWVTDWSGLGGKLKAAWDGPDGFNWDSVGTFFGGIVTGFGAWWTAHTPGWLTDWSGLGTGLKNAWNGPDGFNWDSVGTFFTGIAGGFNKWTTEHFPGWLTDWGQFADGLGNAFSGIGSAIAGHLSGPAKVIGDFFGVISKGVHWLANHFPGVKDVEDYVPPPITDPDFIGPIPKHATGIRPDRPLPGHWAIVGEEGPEAMWVPPNSTIIPNDVSRTLGIVKGTEWRSLPGHADGLNFDFDGILGGAVGLVGKAVGKFLRGTAEKAVNALFDHLPKPDVEMIPGIGQALFDMAKNGLLSFLKPQEQAPATTGGRLSPLIDLIRSAASKYGLPPEIIGAIILHESGGEIGKVEIGGGLGRGLMQVDGGTWPQAFDPRMVGTTMDDAAYQIDVGSMILKRAFDGAQGDIGKALTGYAGTGFAGVHGKTFYQELQDMGLIAEALAALSAPLLGPTIPGGGNWGVIRPVDGPITQKFGQTGFFLEPGGFHDGVDFGVPTGTVVRADAAGMVKIAGMDDGWGIRVLIDHLNGLQTWMAHNQQALVGVGDAVQQGQPVAYSDNTGASTGPHVHWGAHINGAPVDPLSLAEGAWVTRPTYAMVGEGGEGEVVAPESKLREIYREEAANAGGGWSFNFERGAISVDGDGGATVDPSKVSARRLTRAAQAKGLQIGVSR